MNHTTQKNNNEQQGFSKIFIPNRDDTKKQRTNKIIRSIIALVILIALVIGVIAIFVNKPEGKDVVVNNPASDVSSTDGTSSVVLEPQEPTDPETGVLKIFSDQYNKNNDFIGHISISGTQLDLDVAKGKDNVYYLDHTLDKKYDAYGTLMADFRTTVSPTYNSTNITMYGHSGKDGSYCAAAKQYSDLDFYKKHPTLTFDTIYGKGQYKIIGRFLEDVRTDNPKVFNYHDYIDLKEADFNKFVDNVKKRSFFDAPVDTKYGDEFITISTCNVEIVNTNTTPYRDVLVARKVRPDESVEVDISKATTNKDMIMPDGWIAKFGKQNPYK